MSTRLNEDGKLLCAFVISDDCKGYFFPEEAWVDPLTKDRWDVCKPCGDLDRARYYTEHYG